MILVGTRGRTAPRIELLSPDPDYQLRIGDYRGKSSWDPEDEVIYDGAVGLRRTVHDRHLPP